MIHFRSLSQVLTWIGEKTSDSSIKHENIKKILDVWLFYLWEHKLELEIVSPLSRTFDWIAYGTSISAE